jgi:hypothetical protein
MSTFSGICHSTKYKLNLSNHSDSTKTHTYIDAHVHMQTHRQHFRNRSFILKTAENMLMLQNLEISFLHDYNTLSCMLCI